MLFIIRAHFLLRKKPGFPLQFLVSPTALLRDFRCNPLRGLNTQSVFRRSSGKAGAVKLSPYLPALSSCPLTTI
jgi:hypothetical protein